MLFEPVREVIIVSTLAVTVIGETRSCTRRKLEVSASARHATMLTSSTYSALERRLQQNAAIRQRWEGSKRRAMASGAVSDCRRNKRSSSRWSELTALAKGGRFRRRCVTGLGAALDPNSRAVTMRQQPFDDEMAETGMIAVALMPDQAVPRRSHGTD